MGNATTNFTQVERLRERIYHDSGAVQERRGKAWTRFDHMQLSSLMGYAFSHLAKGNDSPFDFSTCRQEDDSSSTQLDEHLANFLSFNPRAEADENFTWIAKIIGSCLVRHELKINSTSKRPHTFEKKALSY